CVNLRRNKSGIRPDFFVQILIKNERICKSIGKTFVEIQFISQLVIQIFSVGKIGKSSSGIVGFGGQIYVFVFSQSFRSCRNIIFIILEFSLLGLVREIAVVLNLIK